MKLLIEELKSKIVSYDLSNNNFHADSSEILNLVSPLPTSLTIETLIIELERETANVPQYFAHKEFSDLSFTIFNNEFFNIDIYIWKNSHTFIHNHNFSGAFKVLKGLIQMESFTFVKEKELCSFIEIGKLYNQSPIRLEVNQVVPIKPFDNFIHRTTHLENPTVTICIRNKTHLNEAMSAFLPNGLKISNFPLALDEKLRLLQHNFFNGNLFLEGDSHFSNLKKDQSELNQLFVKGIEQERIRQFKNKLLS